LSIEYLRLKGFKSFGTSCEFSFSDGLTAIVGPNGSGKSNILDALRWVLGEGTPSTLRIVRQSDLIFQGSATENPSKEAEVLLRLRQNGDTATLRRQYSTEGGSVLQVDSTKIKLQELSDFKSRFALEGDSFAFIGQGEVSDAIHQRPMERRRHLELLFGIDRYRKRREETCARLETALTEMQRINTLVAELGQRREEIAPEVTVAVEAKGILDNLDNIRRDFYFSKRFSLEKREKELRSQLQSMTEHEDLSVLWKNLWTAAVAAMEEKLRRDGFDEGALLAREQELTGRKEALRRQAFAAGTRVQALLSDRRNLSVEKEQTTASLESIRLELEKTEEKETALQRELKTKREAFEDVLRRLEESRANAERERLRRQELRDRHAERILSRSQQEARLKALVGSQKQAEEDLKQLSVEKESLTAAVAKNGEETANLEKRHETLALEHADVYTACQKSLALLQQIKREKVSRQAELDALRENTEASIYPEPTRFLLSAARLGRMKSHPEVMAEAFSCPPEIAPALEAYLGGRQFWLLAHTMEEAQEGIELLKQHRLGRVTYLPLDRCRPRFPDASWRLPAQGVEGWGIELIAPRSPWEPALQHVLGDLLVVRDYALAGSMVKKGAKFPIVTLEGEVFAPSGTISGGRMRQSGGAISHNQRVTELTLQTDALNRRIKDTEAESSRSEKREQKLAQESEALSAALTRSRSELITAQKALETLNADIQRHEAEKNSAEMEIAAITEKMTLLDGEIADLAGQLEALSDPLEPEGEEGKAPSAVSSARNEIELTEERLRGTSDILTRIRRERGDLEERLSGVMRDIEAGKSEETKLRDGLSEMGREHLALWRESRALREKLEAERNRLLRAHNRLQRLRRKDQKAEENLTGLRTQTAAVNERLLSVRAEIEQLREMWDEKYPWDPEDAARIAEDARELSGAMRRLERELKALGTYNLGALSEDESLMERIDYLTEQLEDVKTGIEELRRLIDETDSQVETLFSQAMNDIDDRFNALFQRLFGGGEARLMLQEGGALWERGVEIYARPPGKRLQNISQLSGGEQSLTAIAHLFAALEVARMPLAVLDEVDAALDEYNLIRFADLAREYSKRLQLLVMTHRRTTMERADLLYGVTMVEPGLSKIVGIDMDSYR
jgi:chromosome segregation protein